MGTGDSAAAALKPQLDATDAHDQADDASAALITRLRRQLRTSEEIAAVGRMTAGIAQELNTPLTALLGSLALMTELVSREERPLAPDEIAQLRAALRDSAGVVDRIKDLVAAIRSVSHRDHRNAMFFDPARAIRNATKVFAVVHHRQCRVDLSMGALPALHGSPTGLGQVLLNLLRNGLEASRQLNPDGPARLAVAAKATTTEVLISVTDDGPGIPAEIAPRVFDEFFTSKEGGNGLGLHLSRQIVTAMGGSILFESAPGKTVFTLCLPFAG